MAQTTVLLERMGELEASLEARLARLEARLAALEVTSGETTGLG
jgi:BMFP domain-containing protein YqiC